MKCSPGSRLWRRRDSSPPDARGRRSISTSSTRSFVQAGDAYGPLLRIAKVAGLTADQFDSCMKDHAALSALEARSDRNGQENGISGTPTFVIGDRKLEGDQSLESLGAAVASAEHR